MLSNTTMQNFPIVLGINYGGHDTSACITVGGRLVAACEEERYLKKNIHVNSN